MVALPYEDMSYGTAMGQDYDVDRITFGDGFTQRAEKGINSKPQRWSVTWTNIPHALAEELRVFFEDLGGTALIEWTPFNQALELKWTANKFRSRPTGFNTTTCSIDLIQEFDL